MAANQPKFGVAYTPVVTIATDDHHTRQEFRASVGTEWAFLSDPGRTVAPEFIEGLRAASSETRPDWDLSKPGLHEAWAADDLRELSRLEQAAAVGALVLPVVGRNGANTSVRPTRNRPPDCPGADDSDT